MSEIWPEESSLPELASSVLDGVTQFVGKPGVREWGSSPIASVRAVDTNVTELNKKDCQDHAESVLEIII